MAQLQQSSQQESLETLQQKRSPQESWGSVEMEGCRIRDKRCRKSLATACDLLAERGGVSFSAALGEATRQSVQRIVKDEDTTVEGLLAGHYEQTARRAQGHPLILVAQDSTALNYSGHSSLTELGPLSHIGKSKGLWAHSALAMTPDGVPLGVLDLELWTRDKVMGKKAQRKKKLMADKESRRWGRTLQKVEKRFASTGPGTQVLVIQDREADVFAFLATPRQPRTHLLVRVCQPRRVIAPGVGSGNLLEISSAAPEVGRLQVTIPRRPGQAMRQCDLKVRCTELEIQPPARSLAQRLAEPLEPQRLWVVRATEVDGTQDVKAADWILVTSVSCEEPGQACAMVGYYSKRWMIEQLHHVLKSGCVIERLQHGSVHTLKNAIALLYVVAWHLLYLTHVARTDPELPAEDVLEKSALEVLRAAAKQPITTAQQVVKALGRLGGHARYPAAGPPGVKTLWQGLRRLDAMLEGWTLARNQASYDTG